MGYTVAEALLSYLYHRGVRQIFGIVGREASMILFNEQQGIEFVLTHHEFTAGIMADVLARLTHRPQVCFSTLGPGVTNLTTAVASACLDRSPIIALASQAESYHIIYNQTHQCLDSVSIMKPMTKFAAELTRPEEIISLLDQAFEASMTELPGPSFLSLPMDLLKAEVPKEIVDAALQRPAGVVVYQSKEVGWREKLDQVAELVRVAKHPLIIAGNAVIHGGITERVVELSESLQIPVVTPYTTGGVLPHDHPLNYGAISTYSDLILNYHALDSIFSPVDLILTLGYDYAEGLTPDMWTRGVDKKVVRIASIPNLVHQVFQPDVDVVDSLEDSMIYLQTALAGTLKKRPHDISGVRQKTAEFTHDNTEYPGGLQAYQVVEQINKVVDDGVLVCDVGLFRSFAVLFSQINLPYSFITSSGCSTFGFGLPGAMAARIAKPDKPVIALCGDGGFLSNSQDLETAVRYNLPIVIVVLNNHSNGLIRLYQKLGHQQTYAPPVEFGKVDFVGLARANGCEGFYVNRLAELQPTLIRAIALNRPTLIEIPVLYQNLL